MKTNEIQCPICKLEKGTRAYPDDLGRYKIIECSRCGKYAITSTAEVMTGETSLGYKLIAWIRDNNERHNKPPKITSYVLENLENGIPDYSPNRKQLILLRNIERRTKYPGQAIDIVPEFDYPLSWAKNEKELLYYLKSLIERRLLRLPDPAHKYISELINIVEITTLGWEYLENNVDKSTTSDQVFVAMSFSPSLKPIWDDAIKPAIEKAGYKAYRVDIEPHTDRIDTKIIAEIKNSRFLIADVTEQKQGVYFEAGFALGLGIPVIWSCQNNDLDKVHFDTRQYNHILWNDINVFKEDLYNFICAIIGRKSKS